MSSKLVKTGGCSIVLGSGHYKHFIPPKKNKLLKVVKSSEIHNEFKYLDKVKEIDNYKEYYSIPDEISYLLKPDEEFYHKIKELVCNDEMTIFGNNLQCYYIDYAGDTDLLDSLGDIYYRDDFTFWKSYKFIINFSKKIMDGLRFLHDKKICHLDIKPENIMVDKYKNKFKIIDFGFSSMEPFTDYINEIKGTPGYFPKKFPDKDSIKILPEIKANDMEYVNGVLPIVSNRKLVYKIDSYCLGRVISYVRYIYQESKEYTCFCNESKSRRKLDNIINILTENDINKRLTITQLLLIVFD